MNNKALFIFSLILILLTTTFFSAYAENSSPDVSETEFESNNPSEDLPVESSPSSENQNPSNEESDDSSSFDESIESTSNVSISDSIDQSNADTNDKSQEDSNNDNENSNIDESKDSSDTLVDVSDEQSENEESKSNEDSLDESFDDTSKDDSADESFDDTSKDDSADESFDDISNDDSTDDDFDDTSDESTDESFDDTSYDESLDNSQDESSTENSSKDEESFYSISITQTNGGKVHLNKSSAKKGEIITLSITENKGYELFSVSVNGKTITKNSFTMPSSNVEIVVKFIKITTDESSKIDISKNESSKPSQTTSKDESKTQTTSKPQIKYYNITTFTTGEGSVSLDKETATQGTRIIVTVKPDEGYRLEFIEFNGNKITEIGEKYAFVMPAKNVSVKVSFVKIESDSSNNEISNNDSSIPFEDNSNESSLIPDVSDESIEIPSEESSDITSNITSDVESINSTNTSFGESEIIDVSLSNDDPSSPLMFIIPIIIALAMIGSIVSFFTRKYGNT